MPTPRPIIVASVGATVPMSVTAATSEMIDNAIARPNSAVPIGTLIATTEPNAMSRMTTAKKSPIDVRVAALVAAEVVDDRAAELDMKPGLFGRCSRRLELLHGLGRQAGGLVVVLHAYVADRAVLRHERGADDGRGRPEDLRHVRALAGSEVRLRLRDRRLRRPGRSGSRSSPGTRRSPSRPPGRGTAPRAGPAPSATARRESCTRRSSCRRRTAPIRRRRPRPGPRSRS